MDIWGATDQGNVRKQNQDFYRYTELSRNQYLAVVCDGMGGAKSGDIASRLASDVFLEDVKRSARADMSEQQILALLRDAVQLSNQAVFEQSKDGVEYAGMGTTLVAVLVQDRDAYVANVGDSRCYILRKKTLEQVTEDHSVVGMMVQRGQITEEEARTHPQKNLITRAVGTEPRIQCDCFRVTMRSGSSLLLCTDGLSNQVTDEEIESELTHADEGSCQRLIEIAKRRGAPDNVTVLLLKY